MLSNSAFADSIPPAVGDASFGLQHSGAHHRRRRQRHHQRDEDGHREGHRKFTKQAPDHAAQQEDGNEDGHQRNGHRHDGERNFLGPAQGGLQRRHALLPVTADVLQHDDGIVHDESGRDRQRHQGEIVQTIAEQIHDGEGADQRDRYGHARDQGRANVTDEDEHHQNHEDDRDGERPFDIMQGRANDRRAIHDDREGNGRREWTPPIGEGGREHGPPSR